jgi:bifunctional non-homologous end joining protein LigD
MAATPKRLDLPDIAPQLATAAGDMPEGSDWLHEEMHGGERVLAYVGAKDVQLVGSARRDVTARHRRIASALQALARGRAMVIDGEIEGARLHAFDLPFLDGQDLRDRQLVQRKRRLKALLRGAPAAVSYVDHVSGEAGRRFYGEVVRKGGRGVVSKRKHAHYIGGASRTWVAISPEEVRAQNLDAFRRSAAESMPGRDQARAKPRDGKRTRPKPAGRAR